MTEGTVGRLLAIDSETTGLDPERHDLWELAAVDVTTDEEWVWRFPVTLVQADPTALRINRFYERAKFGRPSGDESKHALEIAQLTAGAHLVGANPSFDKLFIDKMLRRYGLRLACHYHLVDIEALALGAMYGFERGVRKAGEVLSDHPAALISLDNEFACRGLAITLPWKSEDLSRAVGVDPDDFDRHTALGDARWAAAIYRACTHAK